MYVPHNKNIQIEMKKLDEQTLVKDGHEWKSHLSPKSGTGEEASKRRVWFAGNCRGGSNVESSVFVHLSFTALNSKIIMYRR